MRRVLFALLVAAGFLSVVVGASIAFVNPRLSYPSTHTISSSGTIAPYGAESKAGEGVSSMFVDERGYLPIIAGAVLLSVAFLGRQRKK